MPIPKAEKICKTISDLCNSNDELKALFKKNGIIYDENGWRIHGTMVKPNAGLLCMKGAISGYLASHNLLIMDFNDLGNFDFYGRLIEVNQEEDTISCLASMTHEGDFKAGRTAHLTAWLCMAHEGIQMSMAKSRT